MGLVKNLVSKLIIKKVVVAMFSSLRGKLAGKKTYITVATGLIVAGVGVLFGPVDLPGPIDIPAVTSQEFFKLLWEGLLGSFIRAGVAKNG